MTYSQVYLEVLLRTPFVVLWNMLSLDIEAELKKENKPDWYTEEEIPVEYVSPLWQLMLWQISLSCEELVPLDGTLVYRRASVVAEDLRQVLSKGYDIDLVSRVITPVNRVEGILARLDYHNHLWPPVPSPAVWCPK